MTKDLEHNSSLAEKPDAEASDQDKGEVQSGVVIEKDWSDEDERNVVRKQVCSIMYNI